MRQKDIAYDVITDRIIKQLEDGEIPWKKPWSCFYPQNMKTKTKYQGINLLYLSTLGYECNVFGTFHQINKAGGKVMKKEKGYPVIFWKKVRVKARDKKERDEEGSKIVPFIRYYSVFNLEQTEGIEIPKPQENDIRPDYTCERVIQDMENPPNISHIGGAAVYVPKTDTIKIPLRGRFHSQAGYYSTLFHELTHSTGHKSRLNRSEIQSISFSSDKYSLEELVAEIGAAFLCGATGIENQKTIENTGSYVQHWANKLKENKKMLVTAAGRAQKAVNYILGKEM